LVSGNFYFIENQYGVDFPDSKLMANKEIMNGIGHNRPCFYSLIDNATGVYWFIPISSQVAKFQQIYDKKMNKNKEVDTIVFGFVMGHKKAFLIQNMFPATPEYVKNEYIDSITHQPVKINNALKHELNQKAKKVLSLQRKGFHLIFPDVLKIERELIFNRIVAQAIKEAAPALKETEPSEE
ncbi:MAG TPA: hypothetical protein VGE40_04290, partial [Bacilli bacterium]